MGQGFEEYQRQGAIVDRARPILGEWTGTREMDGSRVTVRLLFSASGKVLLLIPFTTQRGNYSARSGRLTASFAPKGSLDGAFTVSNGLLTITRSGGRVTQFIPY
jgi:hypothetical protein